MKIAILLTSLANQGPVLVAYELVCGLQQFGHECEVFYFKNTVELTFPCKIHNIHETNLEFEKYDVVHCHGLRPDCYVLFKKPILCRTPVVTTLHSYLFQEHKYKYGAFFSKLTGWLVILATTRDKLIITLSKDARSYYSRFIPWRKLTYAYNTRSCDKTLPLDKKIEDVIINFKKSSFLLGSSCGLSDVKNLSIIIESLKYIENAKYLVIGDGPMKKIWSEQASRLHVDDRVLFLGKQPDAHRYYKLIDVFVMPSKSEGFPLAMLEAACYGKAIACSDLPVFREIFGDEAAIFDNNDINSVVNTLKYAMKNKTYLGDSARIKYEKCYSPDKFIERHIRIYEEVLGQK